MNEFLRLNSHAKLLSNKVEVASCLHLSRKILQRDRNCNLYIIKGAQSRLNGLKSLAKLFKFRRLQYVSIFSILNQLPLWFIIISLMFFYLCKVLFSGFLQFNGNFVDAQNNSEYRD